MTQTKVQSFVESLANTSVGFGINYCANLVVLPWFGFQVSYSQAALMGVVFTVISVVRGYATRRWFNWMTHKVDLNDTKT